MMDNSNGYWITSIILILTSSHILYIEAIATETQAKKCCN